MAKVLLVHHGEVAIERDDVLTVAGRVREIGHELRCTWEQRGVAGGQVAALEAAIADVDRVLLVDPATWCTREPIDAWGRSLRRIVDDAVGAGIDRFAVVLPGHRARGEPEGSLARLPGFVLPERWGDLVEWLAQQGGDAERGGEGLGLGVGAKRKGQLPVAERRPTLPRHFVANDPAIVALVQAIAAARDRGGVVWIRGAVGTGKSTLVADYLRRRASGGSEPIVHVARPGIAWSCDPEQVLDKCSRALLGPDFVGSLEQALARLGERSKRAIVVLDALEQIVAALSPERMQQLRRALAAGLPRCLTVIVTSRPLAPGVLEREPTLDLDAEPWRTRQAQLVEALVQRAAADGDRAKSPADASWWARIGEHAAGNLGLAAALLAAHTKPPDTPEPTPELELPGTFEAQLERSWTAMLARAGQRHGPLRSGLAILAAAPEPLPISLFSACLHAHEQDAVRSLASEWLHEASGRVGFVHPFVRRFLAPELDPQDPTPHVRLLDALASLRAHASLDEAAAGYQKRCAREHRLACRGFEAGLAWVTDVELLVSLAEQGVLVSRLEAALALADPGRRTLVEPALAVARRRHAELRERPTALPSQLWSELVGHGVSATELLELLRWGTLLPPIRLLNAPAARDRSVLRLVHGGDVRGCAIDAAARRAISVTTDHRLHIWSVHSGERLADLDIGAWAEGCAISADGTRAVVGAGRRVSLWDLDQKTELAHHYEHGADVTTVSMSADGHTVLSTDQDGIVRLWQIGRDRRTQLGRQGAVVRCGAISADGRLAITGDDDRGVVVWDLERGERIQKLPGHAYGLGAVALTSGGELAISICIGDARVWEPRSGQLLHTHDSLGMGTHGCVLVEPSVAGVGGSVEAIEAIVPESGHELHRWRVADGKLLARHFAHAQDMACIAATPDGKWYMTGGQDHVARVWERASMTDVGDLPFRRAITSLRASADPNSFWISGGGDGTRRLSMLDGRELERLSPSAAHGLAEVGDRLVTAGSSRRVEVHSRSSGAELAAWEPTSDWLRTCVVDPTGTRVAYAGDEKLVFCSDLEGKALVRLSGHEDWIRALAWTPAGELVSVDNDGELRVWELEKNTCVRRCSPIDHSAIYALALDGARAFVAGSSGRIVSVELGSGETSSAFEGHEGAVTDLALAEPGMLVSVGRDATLRIWSIDGTDARMLARHDAAYPFTRVVVVGARLVAGDAAGNHLILDVDWERLRGT